MNRRKADYPVSSGDVVEYDVRVPPQLQTLPEAIDLAIVFEDAEVIVVDKPAGMVTHPAHGARTGTLAAALLAHSGTLPGDPLRPGLVHRLDRDTSGLLLAAKTDRALRALGKAMKSRAITREYLGLVRGIPSHARGTVTGEIGRDPGNRLRFAVVDGGKPAVTHFTLRTRLRNAAELQFTLETGRTHQIRVHMAAMGHPLLNDPLYGRVDRRFSLPGQALHAWRLAFSHPVTGEALRFEAQPPAAYAAAKALLNVPAA